MRQRLVQIVVIVGLLAASLPVFSVRPALAAGTVGNGNPASCTEAALDAALAGGGLVVFDCGPGQISIPLTTTKVISNDTQIDGDNLITLDMGDNDRHFYVAPPVTLQLDEIRLDNGSTAGDGGSIWNDGTVIATDVIFGGNHAPGDGGAIRNEGTLTIIDNFFSANVAVGSGGAIYNTANAVTTIDGDTTFFGNLADIPFPSQGGAIYNAGGTLQIAGSTTFDTNRGRLGGAIANDSAGNVTIGGATFIDNIGVDHGGAIHNAGGTVSVSESILTSNRADDGGAVFNAAGAGLVTIVRSTLSSNEADRGGAIWNEHLMRVFESSVFDNESLTGAGAGIFNANTGTLVVTRSAVYENISAFRGGGLNNDGTASILTSTFSDNTAADQGGGILNQNQMTITDSTIAFNTSGQPGGGVRNVPAATLEIGNTIIADNPSGDCSSPGVFNSNDFNLDSDGSCPMGAPNDISAGNADLQALAFNRGPTLNHLPGPASDAIDNGPATCASPDQRGGSRPRNGACDIGSIEIIPSTDVCYSIWTGQLQMPAGGSCNGPYTLAVIFQEAGPHYLCVNPYTAMLTYGAGPVCAPFNQPAIEMPADGPLNVCVSLYTGQVRLPANGQSCTAMETAAILS